MRIIFSNEYLSKEDQAGSYPFMVASSLLTSSGRHLLVMGCLSALPLAAKVFCGA